MVSSATSRNGSRGFTLVEMLVALTLTATMSVAIVEALRFGQRSYEKVARAERVSRDIVNAQRFLRRSIEAAYPQQRSRGSSGSGPAFEGEETQLEFVAPAPVASKGYGLNRYRISLASQDRDSRLHDVVVRWHPDTESRAEGDGSSEILLSNVKSIKWEYLERRQTFAATAGGAAHWHAQWRARSDLPAAVRLNVEFADRGAQRWPELIVMLRVTNDSSCVFDVVAQTCRTVQ